MKNIGTKITVLALCVLIIVGVVGWFFYTQIEPPQVPEFKNEHIEMLNTVVEQFDADKGFSYNDSLFIAMYDKLQLYGAETFIEKDQLDAIKEDFISVFVAEFSELCDKEFNKTSWWDKEKLVRMKTIIAKCRKLQYNNATIGGIYETIADYEAACELADNAKYRNKSQARSDIKLAGEYRSKFYKCKPLARNLSGVKNTISSSHLSRISNKLNRMELYKSMSKSEFNSVKNEVLGLINAFDSLVKDKVYDNASIGHCNSEYGELKTAGEDYFAVWVESKNGWRNASCPNAKYVFETDKISSDNWIELCLSRGYSYTVYVMHTGKDDIVEINDSPIRGAYRSYLSCEYTDWVKESYNAADKDVNLRIEYVRRGPQSGQARIVVVRK